MNRRAASLVVGTLVAVTLPLASPAAAAEGCPKPFELLAYDEQVALAMQVLDISEEEAIEVVDRTLAAYDHNDDLALCYAFQNKSTGHPNIIDNRSAYTPR